MKSEEMSSEGDIGGMPSLGVVRGHMRERKGSGIKGREALRESRTKSRKKREGRVSISIYIYSISIQAAL